MEHIKTEFDDGLLIITMARGKANAINSAMVDEMNAAVEDARNNADVRGLVMASASAKVFSGGFDVKEVFEYDRETMADFFGRFIDLYEGLMRLPKPVVAAVSGHAFAGGAVLALAADKRVMAAGDFGFALNEINIGLALPPGMIRMAIMAVGPVYARELALDGKTFSPEKALEIGLASELASPEQTLEQAIRQAREMAEKPPLTFAAIKNSFIEVTGVIAPGGGRKELGQFIDHWFSAESKKSRQRLIESLRR
jgi:enoyl-CoA hydratase/carnithine racemase